MLVSLKSLMHDAKERHYAVGAFNLLSVEHVRGAIRAAEELRSPLIIQLAEVQFPCAPMELLAPVYLEAAREDSVPVCVHLDHGQSFETCAKAIKLGFNSVMFDGAALPFDENVALTREVSRLAHAVGVDVEAELGKVGDAGAALPDGADDVFTDPSEAECFIGLTGVEALAIAIGNQHGKYVATPHLNITRLKEISSLTSLPLVLHGGSGTTLEDFKSCIHNGICKINVATALQIAVTSAVAEYVGRPDAGYIGMKSTIEDATCEEVKRHIRIFESDGRA